MAYALTIIALLVGFVGIVFASQATIGAAIVGFGAILAIAARMLQANAHHRELHPKAPWRPVANPDRPVDK